MNPSLKTGLTYAVSFAVALLIHAGMATGAGRLVRPTADVPLQRNAAAQQVILHLSFHAPQPEELRTKPVHSVTRPPAPGLSREASALEQEAEVPESLPAEEPVEAATTKPDSETDAAAARSPVVPRSSASKETVPPSLRIQKPRPLRPIDADAVYPLGSRLRGEEGAVRLAVLIGENGRVREIEIDESSGFAALDKAAERAVRRVRFAPATRAGRPVADRITITIRFRLDS